MFIRRGQQFHCQPTCLHPARCVDARTDLEDDVINGKVPWLKFGQGSHCKEALAGILVELLEAEMGKDPVLSRHRHEVCRDADHQKVQQRDKRLEGDPIFL